MMYVIVLLSLLLLMPLPSSAAVFHCADALCLRAAVEVANTNGEPANTIVLEAGTYALPPTTAPSALPPITSRLTIRGAGMDRTILTLAIAQSKRIFLVPVGGVLILKRLAVIQAGEGTGIIAGNEPNMGIFAYPPEKVYSTLTGA